MIKTKILLRLMTLLLLLTVGVVELFGQTSVIADIDFSSTINNGKVDGTVNSMTIGTNNSCPTIINDGRLVLGKTKNTVIVPEIQRSGTQVVVSFDLAFGKLVNRNVYFYLKDAYNNEIAAFMFTPYSGTLDRNTLEISTEDLYYNNNTVIWDRKVSFTITLDYNSHQITTTTSCYKLGSGGAVTNATHTVTMNNTNPMAFFEVGSTYDNKDRRCEFDNLRITTNLNIPYYNVKAVDDSNNNLLTLASGVGELNSSVTYSFPHYINVDGSLYVRNGNGGQGNHYKNTFTLDSDKDISINYTSPSIHNVVYFAEGEDVLTRTEESGNATRNSFGAGGYGSATLTTLGAGVYNIITAAYANDKTNFSVKAGETVLHSHTGKGYWEEKSSNNITISELSPITVNGGSHSYALDYVFIQAVFAFKEGTASYTLGESPNISSLLINTTGHAVTYSTETANVLTVDANTGALTLSKAGRTTIIATAGSYTAKCLVTVRSTTDASGTLAYNATTHIETFTITGEGNFDVEHFEGERISFDVGNNNEVQQVNPEGVMEFPYGLFCVKDDGNITTALSNNIPVSGTYFTFTPKASGVLSITGGTGKESFPIHLVNSEGTIVATVQSIKSTVTTYTFNYQLQAGQTYYVYAQSYWALFLQGFTFDSTQKETMTINVSELFYPTVSGGINSANNKLDRTIPGFTLAFSGNDGATVYNSDRITFHQNSSGQGQLDITPRFLSGVDESNFVITDVTLNYSTIEAGKATSALVNGQSAEMAVGSDHIKVDLNGNPSSLTIKYGSDTDDNSFLLTSVTLSYQVVGQELMSDLIDQSRTATKIDFENGTFYVANSHPKAQTAIFVTPSAPQGYSYGDGFSPTSSLISYESANTSVATVNSSNGTVNMLATNYGVETTITATFAGTDYFLPSTATYTVKSTVLADNYKIEHVKRGMVVEVLMSSDGQSQLNFSNTIAPSQQLDGDDQELLTTYAFDNGGGDGEFSVVITKVSGATAYVHSARAYYKKPDLKLNYTPQAIYNHHGNWTDATLQTRYNNNLGVTTCFDLTGEPPFTAEFEGKDLLNDFAGPADNSTYTLTGNIMFVTAPSSTPKATIRSTGSGSAITDATVSVPVTRRSSTMGYDPNDANNMAVAHLPVIPFPYTWNLASGSLDSKAKALELENAIDDGGSGIKLTHGSYSVTTTGNQGKPATNYYIDPSQPASRLRIPVMQGMKVSITSYGAEERVTGDGYPLQISNVTDLRGYATATLEIMTTSNTQDFLAKDDGYVEIYNRSDVDVHITSITVTAPDLEFEDGNEPEVSWAATYQNRVINQPSGSSLSYSHNGNMSTQVNNMTADGTFTFKDNATGSFIVTATATGAHNLEPCWGQYSIQLANFYFNPRSQEVHISELTSTFQSSYLMNLLYLNGQQVSSASYDETMAEALSHMSFSVSSPSYLTGTTTPNTTPNHCMGIMKKTNDPLNPYELIIHNDGELIVTAVYRKNGALSTVKTSITLNVIQDSYSGFKYSAPTVANHISTYTFADSDSDNPLVESIRNDAAVTYECYYIGKRDPDNDTGTASQQVTLSGHTIPVTNPGVYNLQAKKNGYIIAQFFLTKAYLVDQNTSQSWIFGGYLNDNNTRKYILHDSSNNSLNLANTDLWRVGMPPNRSTDYRYKFAINGNNGFIIQETAGLQVFADAPTCAESVGTSMDTKSHDWCGNSDGHFSAFSGTEGNYANVGLHKSTLVIPHLPKGAYVAVAWDRTTSGQGSTMIMENLLDLEGKTIDVISYGGSVRLTGTNAGINQGYYTFRVAETGDVSFTQFDNGTSRIVAIHVYYGNPDTTVPASDDVFYNRKATERFKGSGMTQQLMAYARAKEDGSADQGSGVIALDGILTIEDETTSQWLTNYLNFGSPNGVPEFKMVNQDETLHNMTMDLSQTYFDSGNGKYAVPGLSFSGGCWGKAIMSVGVRDEYGYLVGYRQYRFTVGIRPKMSYPKTWDFTRFFDNVTAKIEDSPVTVLPATTNINTKEKLVANTQYVKTTISDDPNVKDTDPTRTWDTGNVLMRSSGDESYLQYGYNEYASYYVDDAVLVCNLGNRNSQGFIIEETRGLGFNIAPTSNNDTSKKLQWTMPAGTVGYGENCILTLNGTMTIAKVGEDYKGYYVFLRSSRFPDGWSPNLKVVNSGDYNGIVSNDGQYVFEVTSKEDMTLTFDSDTEIYGIGVTNIKKDAMHPVGGMGWATESRDLDIDYTLTGYYTRHPLRVYEVKYDSYDLHTATVKLTEIKNTEDQTYDSNTEFKDHGYVTKDNGIVLAEFNVSESDTYQVPLFVPAITTTHEAVISNQNMMYPNIIRKGYNSEEEDGKTRFLLTNVHWTFAKDGNLSEEEPDARKIVETDAAGFYRHHVWTTLSSEMENATKNTLAANTAYLLVPTGQLPIAVWNSGGSSNARRNTIGIRFDDLTGIHDMHIDGEEQSAINDVVKSGWYTLDGQKLTGKPTKAGVYINAGRKFVVK